MEILLNNLYISLSSKALSPDIPHLTIALSPEKYVLLSFLSLPRDAGESQQIAIRELTSMMEELAETMSMNCSYPNIVENVDCNILADFLEQFIRRRKDECTRLLKYR